MTEHHAHVDPSEIDGNSVYPLPEPLVPAAATGSTQTLGASPKLLAAVVGAVLAHLLTQTAVDFPAWVDLLIQSAAVALGAYLAPPGFVVPVPGEDEAE